jgi:hypothetical protein
MSSFSVSLPFSNRKNNSGFFYLHKSLDKTPDVWKAGITLSPYSAVRARSKFTWDEFVLDHVYFGVPQDIGILEQRVKSILYQRSGSYINGLGGQTEIFKISETELLNLVEELIKTLALRIIKLELNTPYGANNTSTCPLKLPGESNMRAWTTMEAERRWPGCMGKRRNFPNMMFDALFE